VRRVVCGRTRAAEIETCLTTIYRWVVGGVMEGDHLIKTEGLEWGGDRQGSEKEKVKRS